MKTFRAERFCLALVLGVAIQLGCGGVTAKSTPAPTPVMPSKSVSGPLTGTWSGPMQVTAGDLGQSTITVTATMQHLISNGQSTVTGAVGLAGVQCLPATTLAIQAATFQDPNFAFDVPTANGTLHFSGHISGANTLVTVFQVHGGTCDGASANGNLVRQGSTSGPTSGIRFSFKVPQGGTYGGELWVVVPNFVLAGDPCMIETRAHGVDATGSASDINANWTPENATMVNVTPGTGHRVTITVSTAGTTGVVVSAGSFPDKVLMIEATSQTTGLVCSLTQ